MSRGVEEALQAAVTGLAVTPEERCAVFIRDAAVADARPAGG
jgi:hypothetical protein